MAITGEIEGMKGSEIGLSEADPADFFALMKPRVMSLVVFTAFVGMMIAPGTVHPFLGVVSILCIAIGGGASGALNMWYEADIDAKMSRTAKRPIPAGRVTRDEALTFALVLAALSVLTLGTLVNWLSAALLAFTIFFYAVVYTIWLKRSTPQNIVIGGAAGALPPMIGWSCVTGSVSLESIVLFLIIFLWTPPHFWALALFKLKDYGVAEVPMMPNVAGVKSTKRQIVAYAVATAIVGVLPYLMGYASPAYGVIATALGLGFVWNAIKVYRMAEDDTVMKPAKSLFKFSLLYLFAVFATLLVDGTIARFGA
ncbi:MAG: heme o synthase [Alphaproteobacteria bacterium]|nr:heme o synthase [Alphaproteobacteria bacterium]